MDRALPGHIIDLVRDGVPGDDLTADGGRAVFRALVTTACSAYQRDWTQAGWETEVMSPVSTLGTQLRLKNRNKSRTPSSIAATLNTAWCTAVTWVDNRPPAWSTEEAHQHAAERSGALTQFAAHPDADLTGCERAVLHYAATKATTLRTDRPALPRHTMHTDLIRDGHHHSDRAIRNALASLHAKHLLLCEVPGRKGSTSRRRSSLYRLPTDETLTQYLYQGTWSVVRSEGPPPQTYSPPADEASTGLGPPPQTYSPPVPTPPGDPMVTLTLSSSDPQALADAFAALARMPVVVTEHPQHHDDEHDDQHPATVTTLASRRPPADRTA